MGDVATGVSPQSELTRSSQACPALSRGLCPPSHWMARARTAATGTARRNHVAAIRFCTHPPATYYWRPTRHVPSMYASACVHAGASVEGCRCLAQPSEPAAACLPARLQTMQSLHPFMHVIHLTHLLPSIQPISSSGSLGQEGGAPFSKETETPLRLF